MSLLTAQQVARELGRSPRWVLDAARRGDLPSFKVGKAVRFSDEEIGGWLEGVRRGEKLEPRRTLQLIGGGK